MTEKLKYGVRFEFTGDEQAELLEGVYTAEAGKQLIKAELGLSPSVENSCNDVRYETDDPAKALELIKLAFTISNGGWITIEPMSKKFGVFHLPRRNRDA